MIKTVTGNICVNDGLINCKKLGGKKFLTILRLHYTFLRRKLGKPF